MSQVSIIVPIHNGSFWINNCFNSVLSQSAIGKLDIEICVCNDASTDNTSKLLLQWGSTFEDHGIKFKVYDHKSTIPGGVGFAKNRAVEISFGEYLCFQDIDDVMLPNRIFYQYNKALVEKNNTIIGSKFIREPENSTVRFTRWANTLPEEKLDIQIYTSHGPTVIMPTWFCHRSVFEKLGGFSEDGKGIPEDLIFFYRHLDLGGHIKRVDDVLLIYTLHSNCTTFTITKDAIYDIRTKRLENNVLSKWNAFTIWNAGKQGRKLYKSLSEVNQNKVIAFCDVDTNKIGKMYVPFDTKTRKPGRSIEIIHFKDAKTPLVICVKLDLTQGQFEKNLEFLKLYENVDYILFS